MKTTATLHTDGKGYWSGKVGAVNVTGFELCDYGELRIYFDTATWDVKKDGLIYSDETFMREFRAYLSSIGFPADVSYSEQGMQGDDYVSCDAGPELKAFCRWNPKFGVTRS